MADVFNAAYTTACATIQQKYKHVLVQWHTCHEQTTELV